LDELGKGSDSCRSAFTSHTSPKTEFVERTTEGTGEGDHSNNDNSFTQVSKPIEEFEVAQWPHAGVRSAYAGGLKVESLNFDSCNFSCSDSGTCVCFGLWSATMESGVELCYRKLLILCTDNLWFGGAVIVVHHRVGHKNSQVAFLGHCECE
jgi:hypothetical protein